LTKYLSSYVDAVRNRLQEVEASEEISTTEINDSIELAVRYHSRFRPQIIVDDIAGSGVYDLTLPDTWEKDFSVILAVECPQGSRTPTYLEPKDWMLYRGTSGNPSLRLLSFTPSASQTVRITFTHTHLVTASTTTIQDEDYWAVGNLAASMAARLLAARYARVWGPVLNVDVVNYPNKSEQYLALAKECENIWRLHLGLPPEGAPSPSFQYGDWDMTYSWNRGLLVHKPEYR